jgi:hypothetical protein
LVSQISKPYWQRLRLLAYRLGAALQVYISLLNSTCSAQDLDLLIRNTVIPSIYLNYCGVLDEGVKRRVEQFRLNSEKSLQELVSNNPRLGGEILQKKMSWTMRVIPAQHMCHKIEQDLEQAINAKQ